MKLLSELRTDEGSIEQAYEVAKHLSRSKKSGIWIAGEDAGNTGGTVYKAGSTLARFNRDHSKMSLFGVPSQRTSTWRELLANHPATKPYVYTDIAERFAWMKMKLVPAKNIRGAYSFCFRDYVNYEELNILLGQRWCIERFLLRTTRSGQVFVDKNECKLYEQGCVLGFIPFKVEWLGSIEGDQINWTNTSVRLGFGKVGKTMANPLAEKLRQQPWIMYVPEDDPSGDVAVFHRVGVGRLVYARESRMKTNGNSTVADSTTATSDK
jgi:hypothetical protein